MLPHNRSNLSQEKIRIINSVLNKIPQLSLSVRKIIEMASDKDVDSKELVEVASSDPVLASKILMMVNSSYYGLNHKIDNLRLAIVLLGFNEVRNLALQFGFMQALSGLDVDRMYDPKTLWVHSYLVSICAESFSREDDPKRAGVLMTLGILHDIGKFALHAIGIMMEKKGIKIESKKVFPPDVSLLVIEENLFGVNHSVIGAMLAERWNLSERTCAVIEHHHSPLFLDISEIQDEYIEDITITCMSDIIVNSLANDGKKFSELHPAFYERLGLIPPLEKLITDELRLKISTAEEYARNLE
ncbi:HDOD domain-containing protein [bacterium]|nr:HDOD domain-containing protein [bacterium]